MSHGLAQTIRDQRRDRILQTARDVFFEEGYGAATMSMIAARLGGSKGTLYAYFKNKEDLFEEIIRDQCSVIQSALGMADQGRDVRTTLTAFGLELVTAMASDWAVRTLQLVIEEAVRNPELARRFDQAGPRQGAAAIAAYLAKAHERGEICTPDPLRAANVLGSLLKGELHFRRMLGLEPEPSAELIAREVETAVNVFLAAYAPK
jgi:AcrR family transcriptional regulator